MRGAVLGRVVVLVRRDVCPPVAAFSEFQQDATQAACVIFGISARLPDVCRCNWQLAVFLRHAAQALHERLFVSTLWPSPMSFRGTNGLVHNSMSSGQIVVLRWQKGTPKINGSGKTTSNTIILGAGVPDLTRELVSQSLLLGADLRDNVPAVGSNRLRQDATQL